MNDKATPRPWLGTTPTPYGTRIVESAGVTLAFCGAVAAVPGPSITPQEAEENARLIVAAVNAYEAHQRAAEALRQMIDSSLCAVPHSDDGGGRCGDCRAVREARAALAALDKAEGRS